MNTVEAVLDLDYLRMVDTGDGLHFFKGGSPGADIPVLYLDEKAKKILSHYLRANLEQSEILETLEKNETQEGI